MNREEAIEVYNGLINTKIKEAFEFFAPELAESEDDKIRKAVCRIIEQTNLIDWDYTKEQMLAWLEKQKEQKPAEWSEEDKEAITNAIRACRYMTENFENSTKQYEDAIERLKSLRPDSYKNCNSRWKPSEEQMKALEQAKISAECGNFFTKDGLKSLYEQLKAL